MHENYSLIIKKKISSKSFVSTWTSFSSTHQHETPKKLEITLKAPSALPNISDLHSSFWPEIWLQSIFTTDQYIAIVLKVAVTEAHITRFREPYSSFEAVAATRWSSETLISDKLLFQQHSSLLAFTYYPPFRHQWKFSTVEKPTFAIYSLCGFYHLVRQRSIIDRVFVMEETLFYKSYESLTTYVKNVFRSFIKKLNSYTTFG